MWSDRRLTRAQSISDGSSGLQERPPPGDRAEYGHHPLHHEGLIELHGNQEAVEEKRREKCGILMRIGVDPGRIVEQPHPIGNEERQWQNPGSKSDEDEAVLWRYRQEEQHIGSADARKRELQ